MTPWQQFGLIGLLSGSGTILLFIIIKWVLQTTREIMIQAGKEREAWTAVISQFNESNRLYQENTREAHTQQRREHQEMIVMLGRINGHKI